MTITVLVVSPYPTVRAGLRALLEAAGDVEVGWEVEGAAGLRDSWPVSPVVALVDEGAGVGVLETLETLAPDVGVVVLGGEPGTVRWESGTSARGYLTRDASAEEILAAVRAVAQGLVVVDLSLAASLMAPGAPWIARAPREFDARLAVEEALTRRELQVLQLLAAGMPNKTIAVQLDISEHTVKFHVSSLLAKLGAASRTEAVTTAARRGLLLL